jgi:CDP-glucose 4,6-dehydratase
MSANGEPGNWQDRNVLVTGAGGFVGSSLVAELIRRSARVVGIVRDSSGTRQLEARGIQRRLDVVSGSICDFPLLRRLVGQYEIDTIFHLAAHTSRQTASRSPLPALESNVAGTWNVLEAARLSPAVERVVVASTDKAGSLPGFDGPESISPGGPDPYDASKACCEILTRCYAASFPLPIAVVRCANVYGPGDTNWSRLVPGTVRSALTEKDPVIRSDGTPRRDYLYLQDAVEGYLAAAEHLPEISGRTVRLGSGRTVSVLELVELIIAEVRDPGLQPRVLGTEASRSQPAEGPFPGVSSLVPGWRPTTSLADGVASTVAWYRDFLLPGRVLTLHERAR